MLCSLDIPVRLIAIPEGALQGFNDEVMDVDHAEYARTCAIDIPGPETDALGLIAREHRAFVIAEAKSKASGLAGSVLQRWACHRSGGSDHPPALQALGALALRALRVAA